MKRNFGSKLFAALAIVMMLCLSLSLQAQARKPDLTILKITVARDCKLAVVVRNNGPGMLPDFVYTNHHPKSAGVFVYINGKSWGGESIWKFDPGRKLQKPGGVTTCILNYKVGPPIHVKAVVDLWNDVKEANERNNTRIRRKLSCRSTPGRRMPDLVVRDIKLIRNCKIEVTIKNIGTAGVASSYYETVSIQMYKGTQPWGGIILKGFDPAGKLKVPGGTATHVWFPLAANLNLGAGTHSIKVVADNGSVLPELNETNNTRTERLTCRKLAVATSTPVVTATRPPVTLERTPKRFLLNFKDAYLVYTKSSKSIQIAAEKSVLSYGSDWQKCQLTPTLFHIRQNVWKGFYWEINTARNVVYRVDRGSFCKGRGKKKKLNMTVKVIGDNIFLYFSNAMLVYETSTKSLQISTEAMVLSYGSDWQKCKLKPFLYELKQNVWQGFYWKINTSKKQAWKITGAPFCQMGGSETPLANTTVQVVY